MISVIIPVYGVEKYIERCAISLFSQTYKDIEYIFVDDASPDGSIDILNRVILDYPDRNVKIVHHPVNKGLPSARNTGMAEAKGDYIFHCDSDDFMEPNMLELMAASAEANDADMVWCDWFLTYEDNERLMRQPSYAIGIDALKGMLNGQMKYNVWNKLVRRSIYENNHIEFPAGYSMGEDMTLIRVAAHCNKVSYVDKALYHYIRTNPDAMTNVYSDKQLQSVLHNVEETEAYLRTIFNNSLDKEIACFKLNTKLPFLIGDNVEYYKLWTRLFPEADKFIWDNTGNSLRIRIIEFLASKHQFWAVKSYYKIHRTLYKILFQ